jgi:hypothetical protein
MRVHNFVESDISVIPVERIEVAYAARPWAFAAERRSEIDAHFAMLRRSNAALWNGRVLMLRDFAIADGVFRGAAFEADYASFIAWQDWRFPDRGVYDCFAMGVIRSSDGGVVLGVMGPHTANAGQIYCPCGTPDPSDVAGASVDFEGSVRREVAEETGLDISEFVAAPGWHAVIGGNLIVQIKCLQARETSDDLIKLVRAHLARERQPELSDVRIARSAADFVPAMPPFVTAFLCHLWSRT